MTILNPPRPLRPCIVCGNPTRAKRGICTRTKLCRAEAVRIQRRESGIGPRKPKKYADLPKLKRFLLHTNRTTKQAAKELKVSMHQIRGSIKLLGLARGWYFPDEIPAYPQAIPVGSCVGLKLVQRIYKAVTQKDYVTADYLSKRFECTKQATVATLTILGMKFGWVELPDSMLTGNQDDEGKAVV